VRKPLPARGRPGAPPRSAAQARNSSPRRETAADPELLALRGQLRPLQSAATELVDSEDVASALDRIVSRAAGAVLASTYLLAVRAPHGGEPLVHSPGLPSEVVPAMAAELLDGGDLSPWVPRPGARPEPARGEEGGLLRQSRRRARSAACS
jgi:hypothetical protein